MIAEYVAEEIPLADLHSHPRQDDFFMTPSEAEIDELADDLETRGQQEPIHVCPDGTIVRGHRRVAAARQLGWETIEAVIRHDLSDPLSSETIDDLIRDNAIRQQLDDLALARCYEEMRRSCQSSGYETTGNIRDWAADRLNAGISGRTLDRKRNLLKLPRDIQDMISRKQLNQHQAGKILCLREGRREAIYEDLRSGQPVSEVLRRHGLLKDATPDSPADRGQELLNFLRRNLTTLDANLEELDRLQVRGRDVVELLEDASGFLSDWAERKRMLDEEAVEEMQSLLSSNDSWSN